MELLQIGLLLKAQGIKGELKVLPFTDGLTRFTKLVGKEVYLEDTIYKVKSARVDNKFAYVGFEGINTRNDAEKLVDKRMYVTRENAVKLPKGSYFIVDLVGCSVSVDGEELGKLTDVLQYGSADVYVVTTSSGSTVMFPALKKVLKHVDTENKRIELDKSAFDECAVYEED